MCVCVCVCVCVVCGVTQTESVVCRCIQVFMDVFSPQVFKQMAMVLEKQLPVDLSDPLSVSLQVVALYLNLCHQHLLSSLK